MVGGIRKHENNLLEKNELPIYYWIRKTVVEAMSRSFTS
jgi:hypothetical protein